MAESSPQSLEPFLRQIEAAAPEPWYPKMYAESAGVPRDSLDGPLERLRMAGLIRLTEWVKDRGQGYTLTPEGIETLKSERGLARLRDGRVPQPPPVARPPAAQESHWSAWDRGEDIRQALLNPPEAIVGKALLFAIILAFVAGMVVAMQANVPANVYLYGRGQNRLEDHALLQTKHTMGALWDTDLLDGGWWRLLGHVFVHHGILHLAMNGYALYMLSKYLEPMWGHVRFLILFLFSGFGGGCAAMIFRPNALLGGASGALCGLIAAEAAWLLLNKPHLPSQLVSAWMRNIGTNIILIVIISLLPGVSASAHFGGAVVGGLTAILLHNQRYGRGIVRWAALGGTALVPVACAGALLAAMNTNSEWVKLRAAYQRQQVKGDFIELRDRFGKEVLPAENEAKAAYEKAFDQALQMRPSRRNAERTKEAITLLSHAQDKLNGSIQSLSATRPLDDPSNEAARQKMIDLLRTRLRICGLAETYLREDRNFLNEDKEAIEQQQSDLNDIESWLTAYFIGR